MQGIVKGAERPVSKDNPVDRGDHLLIGIAYGHAHDLSKPQCSHL